MSSRAAGTKSRADKVKGASSFIPIVAHEIVPGKFTDQDWFSMLDRDDGTEFAADLVDEIVVNALSVIYDKYIQEQLLPFTISQAKDAIIQIIEWQFLSRDELETDVANNQTWQEDIEPVPAVTDCWAQGVVPRQIIQTSPTSRSLTSTPERTDVILEDVEAETEAQIEKVCDDDADQPEPELVVSPEVVDELPDTGEIEDYFAEESLVKVDEKTPQPPAADKPKRKFKPHKGRLKSVGLGAVVETLYETEMRMRRQEQSLQMQMDDADNLQSSMPSQSVLKSQASRPAGNKDFIYDEHGNVVSLVKINTAKLPSHFVKAGYCIVDPEVEAAKARLQAMRTGDYIAKAQQQKKKKLGTFTNRGQVSTASSLDQSLDFTPGNVVLPLPPPLIEMMEIAPGIIVKEGERVKRGPKKWGKTGPQVPEQSLRLVRPPPEQRQFAAFDILGAEKPIIRLIRDTPVIPPIPQNGMSRA